MGNVFTGEHSTNLYAPEVFYWNGAFYCISCPEGTTNYCFKSNSPEGPFTAISDALGGGIDGSLFRDDDGTIYFTHAEFGGIALYRMETPESEMVSLGKLSVSVSGMWTEGPGIFKRDGKYYMTYCGNHVLDPAYRVEYAVSDRVDAGWTEPEQNVLLLSTEGTLTGLGHNSMVIGPDLDTYYIIYHNRYPDGTKPIDRAMNIQPILWSGDRPVAASGESFGQDPALPTEEYRPTSGTESLSGQKLLERETGAVFTAEFNFVPATTKLLFGYRDEQNYCVLRFEGQTAILETVVNGTATTESTALPKNTATDVLQCVRVQQNENMLTISLAGGTLLETSPVTVGGKIGYRAENGTFGYTAFSGTVLGNYDAEVKKYPFQTYPATLFNQSVGGEIVSAEEPGNALLLNAGEKASYTISVSGSHLFSDNVTLTLRGKATENTRFNIYLDDALFAESVAFSAGNGYRTEILCGLPLIIKRGERKITVEVVCGSFEFYEFATAKETELLESRYNMDRRISAMSVHEGEGTYENGEFKLTAHESPKGDCFAKTILGSSGNTDYSVEVRLRLESTAKDAEAGVFLRSANESDGEACAFRFRRKWYQQCYYVCVKNGAVLLYKQDYGEELLKQYSTSADFTQSHLLKVSIRGCELTVWLDGVEIIRYTDDNHPFTNGRYGFKVVNGTAYYDDLTVTALAVSPANQPQTPEEETTGVDPASEPEDPGKPQKSGCRSTALPVTSLIILVFSGAFFQKKRHV